MPSKKSTLPLRNLCWTKVTNNLTGLEHQIAKLPYELINELYRRLIRCGYTRPLPSHVFLNPTTTKLHIYGKNNFDLPINKLVDNFSQSFKNLSYLAFARQKHIQHEQLEMLIIQIPNIQHLKLIESNCTDSLLFSIITRCSKLRRLNLDYCRNVTDVGVVHLCTNTQIVDLSLYRTSVTDQGHIMVLKKLPCLKSFDFRWSIEFFRLLEDLTAWKFNSLEFLSSIPHLTENTLKITSMRFPNLRSFTISSRNVNESVNFPRLQKLRVRGNHYRDVDFNNVAVSTIIGKHLTYLILTDFTDLDVSIVLHHCCMLKKLLLHNVIFTTIFRKKFTMKNLKSLNIMSSNIEKHHLVILLASTVNLKFLYFANYTTLTDEIIIELTKNNFLRTLLDFQICNSDQLTANAFKKLLDGQNSLKKLSFNHCRNIMIPILTNYIKSHNLDVVIS